MDGIRKFATTIVSAFKTHKEAKEIYSTLSKREISPLGPLIHLNPHVPEDQVIGFHGGHKSTWIDQARSTHSVATGGGLYVANSRVAFDYAKCHEEPVITQIAAEVPPQTDLESGIGAHLSIRQGTPFTIRAVHAVNPEYIKHMEELEKAKADVIKTTSEIGSIIIRPFSKTPLLE